MRIRDVIPQVSTRDRRRDGPRFRLIALLAVALAAIAISPVSAQDDDDDDVRPAPASVGADVPLTYFGPAPSDVDEDLIGPVTLLKAGQVDEDAGTITLPLYEGRSRDGRPIWYVVTDTTDAANAAALGLNHSPKLSYAEVGTGVRQARIGEGGTLNFLSGATVDFAPEHSVTPGPEGAEFPPADVQPGSVGDARYSPLVKIINAGGEIYNAPMIAYGSTSEAISACDGNPDYSLVHDKVVSICPEEGTVTLEMTLGFSFSKPVFYLSMDANDPVAASLERATLAPGMNDIDVGADDSLFSAVERIFLFANGPTGEENPQRQGLNSALRGEGGPLNILGGIPTVATDYSPLWDVNLGVWTDEAIQNGYVARETEEFRILGLVDQGWVTGPGGAPYGSTGILVNCPIVHRLL